MRVNTKAILTILMLLTLSAIVAIAAAPQAGILGWGESSKCNTVNGITICAYAYAYVEPYGDYGYVYGKVYTNPYEMLCFMMTFQFTSVSGRSTPVIQHYELKYAVADEGYWLPATQLGDQIEVAEVVVGGRITSSYAFCPSIPHVATSTWASRDY